MPLVLLAGVLENMIRNIPNSYSYKKNYLDKNAGNIEVLIFGDSHAYNGVNPEMISKNAFNAAFGSQSLDYDIKIFNKYKNDLEKLKIIVFCISYHSLITDLKFRGEDWRIKNYLIYFGLKGENDELRYKYEIFTNRQHINIINLFNYYIKGKDNIISTKLGWAPLTDQIQEEAKTLQEGKERAVFHTFDIYSNECRKIYAEHKKNLVELFEYCTNNGIEVILLELPAYQSYYNNLASGQLSQLEDTLNDFTSRFTNVHYINWLKDTDFLDDDFANIDHLNVKGANKLSVKLDMFIRSLDVFN